MSGDPGTREAFRSCDRLTRGSRTNFYFPLLLLPARKREALITVYAFCRLTDDIADDPTPGSGPAAGLRAWREELDRTFAGRPTHPITRSLRSVVRRYTIPKTYFHDLIRGVEMDTEISRYPTFEALYPYCYRVASTVGLICIEIFGYRELATRRYAKQLGVALQLTNIVRDVKTDAARGRIYIPQEDLRRFGCSEEDLAAGRRTPAFRSLMEFQCQRARSYYRRAWRSHPGPDRETLLAAEAMGRIYYEILQEVERREYDVFAGRVRLSGIRKIRLAADVWVRKALGLPRGWPPGLSDQVSGAGEGGPAWNPSTESGTLDR